MLLHEAVRKARKDLGLSQQKLADAAGIQRRQLATLEQGGNVTLATVRKVLGQLPNLETFTLDTIKVQISEADSRSIANAMFGRSLEMLGFTLRNIGARMQGGQPTEADLAAVKKLFALFADTVASKDDVESWSSGVYPDTEAVVQIEAGLEAESEPEPEPEEDEPRGE